MRHTRTVIKRGSKGEPEKPFWISYADLMTALMVLFLVVMSVALLAVTKTASEVTKTVTEIERQKAEAERQKVEALEEENRRLRALLSKLGGDPPQPAD